MCKFLTRLKKQPTYWHGIEQFFPSDKHNIVNLDEYFSYLKQIKGVLLEKSEFENSVPYFFINIETVKLLVYGDLNAIRLKYFTSSPKKTKKAIKKFENKNKKIITIPCQNFLNGERPRDPEDGSPSESKYIESCIPLYWLTRIGLDLIDCKDFLKIRTKMVAYRKSYSFSYSPGKDDFSKPVLEPIFYNYSEFFKKMNSFEIERLWKELDRDNRTNHHLVNMLLLDYN